MREAVSELGVLAEKTVSRVDGLQRKWTSVNASNGNNSNGVTHLGPALMADLNNLVYTKLQDIKRLEKIDPAEYSHSSPLTGQGRYNTPRPPERVRSQSGERDGMKEVATTHQANV